MNLPKDFREFIEFLDAREVEYAIVGGYAVAYHGYPRFTGDLDVLVVPSERNAQALLQALADFGFADVGLSTEDFRESGTVIQLGHPPLRIDLITAIDGVTAEEVITERVQETDGSLKICFISRDHLLRNKKHANRPKDIADLEYL